MKIRLFLVSLAFISVAQANSAILRPPSALAPAQHQAQLASLISHILARYDYQTTTLDNAMSEKIFDAYLKALDPQKYYFCKADTELFTIDRSALGNAIYQEDLQIPFQIFNVYLRRIVERFSYERELLKRNFHFDRKENFDYDRGKEPWVNSVAGLRNIWRKRVKNDWLQLKLSGEGSSAIRRILDERYSDGLARAYKFRNEDVFQIFMDAYATSVEPHTDYLGSKAADEFDIEMKLSLVGIGAVFQPRDGYLIIRELVPGGPAATSSKLDIGDRLIAVGQGRVGPMLDVVGMRFDDVSTLVRGTIGSVVRLDVLPAGAGQNDLVKHVVLIRGKINFEQDAAKKSVIQVKDGLATRQIGVISLPTFYQDFDARSIGEKNFKSASRDIARLLDELKHDEVDSVLVDLRNNGGGSLDEAVELTGLFIGKGPVVQERNAVGKVHVEGSNHAEPAWSGPLAVLINHGSASASEIFAAAVQDYGRGIIIGENSFGKGTMQTIVNLDKIARNERPEFGELKMTIAQIFRVNGDSTQLRGVAPDINFPSSPESRKFVESNFDNALPWTKIDPASYSPIGKLKELLPELLRRHELRIAKDKNFQTMQGDIGEFKLHHGEHVVSLNETERRKERDAEEAGAGLQGRNCVAEPSDNCAKLVKDDSDLLNMTSSDDNGFESDKFNPANESAVEEAQKDVNDVWLDEAAHILSDEAGLISFQRQSKISPD